MKQFATKQPKRQLAKWSEVKAWPGMSLGLVTADE